MTSTSPSGEHLGDYKALLSPAALEADNDNLVAVSDRIIEAQVAVLNRSASHDSPLERRRQIAQVMIEKKAGNQHLNKLRTINVFEADCNWLISMIFG